MSVSREITVVCDICRSNCDSTGWTNADARQQAHDDGWRRRKIDGEWLDVCPDCLNRITASHMITNHTEQKESRL